MSTDRHVTWENFRDSYIVSGDPALHVIDGTPRCEFFVDNDGERIGLRVATDDIPADLQLQYQHINATPVRDNDDLKIQISCDVQSLFEPFYAMLISVSDLVQLHDRLTANAIQESADKFFNLLSCYSILSEEKQVGLWCELWVLKNLIEYRGSEILRSWTGPREEPHDFRLDGVELEVKGTRSRKRSHIISSEDQLMPSPDSDLFLLSIQLGVGAGMGSSSLPERVRLIVELLEGSPSYISQFEMLLAQAEYQEAHARFYNDDYILRTPPTLVPITEDVPRITSALLRDAVGPTQSRRLSDIQYRLDVTDLGYEESDDAFHSVQRDRSSPDL